MKYKLLAYFLLLSATVFGQVKFTCSAPQTAIAGKPFNVVYSLNSNDGRNLVAPEFSDLELLAGPYSSTSTSVQIINGKTTSSVTVSYSYTLLANKAGNYSIPPASITVDGNKISSNGAQIKVVEADKAQQQSGGDNGSQQAAQTLTADNLFVRTIVSKSNPYEQEPILVTYKVYTLVDISHFLSKKFPDFKGFLKQDFDNQANTQLAYETYNGKNYGTAVIYQTLLFPQRAGELTIDKATFEAVVRLQNRSRGRSIFDDFFESYTNVNKELVAPAVKISVKPLPDGKPAGFNDIVGRFTLSSSISANEVKANQAVTIKVTINGNGNMKLIKTPEIVLPDGFEVYDPKVSNNFKTTTDGVNGSKTVEYMFIPRHDGDFEIPSASFSYFDTQDKIYKTLKTDAFRLKVLKDGNSSATAVTGGNYVNKEDVKQLARDIRYIETGNYTLSKSYTYLFGTVVCWLAYLVPLFVSLLLYFVFRKNARDNSDIQLVKNRRANRVAQKRLRAAKKLLTEGKKDLFYEEIMKALWDYLSDKLNIPAAALTKDAVTQQLAERGIGEQTIAKVKEILNTCEFARYAPPAESNAMGNLYEETIAQISDIESNILRTKRQ
ncbi:MAG: BatD family protein [Paludibacter sp.]|jgi:hypothetical protein|nr:BatD family protein [Paludibacter sp.]